MTGGWFMTLFYPHYSNFVESWNEIRIGEAKDLGLDTFIWDYLGGIYLILGKGDRFRARLVCLAFKHGTEPASDTPDKIREDQMRENESLWKPFLPVRTRLRCLFDGYIYSQLG